MVKKRGFLRINAIFNANYNCKNNLKIGKNTNILLYFS
ncbi:hypothetical protein SAMN05216464_111223 [Mucilaginibacter pineti]|uniref:Uncharacterized protein n=1 Tax=Mucilaginibacter pineti TaxID=1391627 RepID=A0A1G7HGX0_9SPHI|nr:hypothetical protein SAMN05216464_111223 [Mucilaginibacter pineti]